MSLPAWEPGTVTILTTAGEPPHAIPVSAALRAGPHAVVLALAARRESLARLRADGRCALTLLAAGDVAVTAHGRATVVADPLAEGVVGVRLDVDRIQDHNQATFTIDAGVAWRWTDAAAERRDAEVRAALEALAAGV